MIASEGLLAETNTSMTQRGVLAPPAAAAAAEPIPCDNLGAII